VARVLIAVVIPALDEAEGIAATISSALGSENPDVTSGTQGSKGRNESVAVEVIVVDGGSRDETAQRARGAGARVISAQRGRARQLQVGFQASKGDVVLFLHADTRLPPGWAGAVRSALDDARAVGGAFRLRFDDRSARMRRVERWARLRIALLRFPFGDQGIFVRRPVLEAIGGVPDVPLMEDCDLVREMKRHGRLALLSEAATTSARRYFEHGVGRTSILHFVAFVAFWFGVDRTRIAGWLGR
jgi:rSAM/selenodomain-associated transferase 2